MHTIMAIISLKVLKNLGSVLFRFDVLNYLWAFGVAGAFFGFLETYLFWHMQVHVS